MLSGSSLGHPPYERAKPSAPLLPEVQEALDRVEEQIASGARDVLLLGAPRAGKTLLLRHLAMRPPRPGRVFYCPFLHFGPEEAIRWLLTLLRLPPDAGEERLVSELMRGGRPWAPNLLLLDEAQAIPAETLRHLATLLRRCDWGLCRVWAGIDGAALYRIPRVVDADMPRVPLIYRPDESEARAELRAVARGLTLSSAELRAKKALGRRRPKPPNAVPRDRRQVPDGQASRGMPREQEVASGSPAVRETAARRAGAAPLAAFRRSPEPAVANRLRRPGRVVSTWRRARIAVSAAVVAGVGAGLLSVLSRTTEFSDAATLPVAAAPVLVDINAVPWAHIVVDGREVGVTPIGNLSLAPGSHRIQARFGHGELAEQTVEVSGENRRVGFRGASAGRNGQR
jgi:hypothetical protein